MIVPNPTLELSLEQLIGALNKKLFTEFARVQSAMLPMSRAQVATLAVEVWYQKLKRNIGRSRNIFQIDALEKRAVEVIRELPSLRNSLRPVNRLPPEVLTSCAAFVSETDPIPIISLTHVCRYWHTSITSNPRSWASIATEWKRLVPLCLERAKSVPLAVDITVSGIRSDEDFLGPLLPQISRIGRLRLAGYSKIETVAGSLPGFFDLPMPNLTSLELQQTRVPGVLFPPREAPVPPIFQSVGKLRSLNLTRTPLYPALLSITSLKELRLLRYPSQFHFGRFLGFLESNPGLELVVLGVGFVEDSVETPPSRKVTLLRLQYLSITCSQPIDSKGLLSSIHLPHGVRLEVVFTQSDAGLSSFLPSPPTPILELLAPITTIKTQAAPQEVHLFGNDSVFTFRSEELLLDPHGELELFPSAAVRELYTSLGPYSNTEVDLSKTLRLLPALETLAFSGPTLTRGVLYALAEEPSLCPALKTIAFFDCNTNTSIMRWLGDAVAKRKDSAVARLYRVVIVDSAGTIPDLALIRELRKSVPCVEVRVDDKLPDLSWNV